MKTTAKKRGRPRKDNPATAAERMRAYRKRKRDAGLKNVRRWEPADGPSGRRYSDHRILDARSLAMHCKIAQKIARDPELLGKAKANLERWSAKSEDPQTAILPRMGANTRASLARDSRVNYQYERRRDEASLIISVCRYSHYRRAK